MEKKKKAAEAEMERKKNEVNSKAKHIKRKRIGSRNKA